MRALGLDGIRFCMPGRRLLFGGECLRGVVFRGALVGGGFLRGVGVGGAVVVGVLVLAHSGFPFIGFLVVG